MSAAPASPRVDLPRAFRDDGPLARAVGRLLGPRVGAPGPVLAFAGVLPLLAVAALGGGDVALPAVAAALAWAVLLGGASGGRRSRSAAWVEPPAVRLTEYVALIWMASLEGPEAYPAAFALIAVLAFRNYDLAYRLRHQGTLPPAWVGAVAGGWDGRVVAAFALLAAGALPTGLYVAAAALGAVFLGESAASWVAAGRGAAEYDDDEEDDEL